MRLTSLFIALFPWNERRHVLDDGNGWVGKLGTSQVLVSVKLSP